MPTSFFASQRLPVSKNIVTNFEYLLGDIALCGLAGVRLAAVAGSALTDQSTKWTRGNSRRLCRFLRATSFADDA